MRNTQMLNALMLDALRNSILISSINTYCKLAGLPSPAYRFRRLSTPYCTLL